jgi:hypothetical protein
MRTPGRWWAKKTAWRMTTPMTDAVGAYVFTCFPYFLPMYCITSDFVVEIHPNQNAHTAQRKRHGEWQHPDTDAVGAYVFHEMCSLLPDLF